MEPSQSEAVAAAVPPGPADPGATLDVLLALLDAGGPVVLILVALSITLVAAVLLKFAQFVRLGVWRRSAAGKAVALARRGRLDEAIVVAGSGTGVGVRIVAAALWGLRRGDLAVAEVRDEATRLIDETSERLRSNVRILEVIASLAPLLGLFGTVLGMIDAFQKLEASGSRADPAILSGGIWEALLTTAVGLAVAMPAVVLVNLIDRSIESLVSDLDNMVAQIVNRGIGGESLVPAQGTEAHALHRPLPAGE